MVFPILYSYHAVFYSAPLNPVSMLIALIIITLIFGVTFLYTYYDFKKWMIKISKYDPLYKFLEKECKFELRLSLILFSLSILFCILALLL